MDDKNNDQIHLNLTSSNGLCIGEQLIIGNMAQYLKDKELYNFDKLCLVKIENADLLLTYLGEEKYLLHLKKAFLEVYEYMKQNQLNGILSSYIMDRSTVIITGKPQDKKEVFLKIVETLHKNFQYLKLYQTNTQFLARFAIVINQPNMLGRALEEFHDEGNIQKHFIVSEHCSNKTSETEQELKMINIIYWAIQHDGVIPYYQGIFDNNKKCIEKYEALMRIRDSDGNIYSPNSFIAIAKKYHIYIELSTLMIRRVLLEIDDKNMEVSVNLSAYDINSSDFRKSLFELLTKRKSQKLLVFEILEDEIFKDIFVLKQFISQAEKYGVKIAIDDFGSGYSNSLEIMQTSPHYIKIDGCIISALNESNKNRMVLESIVSLSQKLNALTIAEHVENAETQKLIELFNIDFSQGYYFSKPVPIEEL